MLMRFKNLSIVVAVLAISLLSGTVSHAVSITSASDPSLAGGTVVNFESTALGTHTPLTVGNVTFTSSGWRVANDYAGQYNSRGLQYLDNNAGQTPGMTFDFATPVSAFGFLWGASDAQWVLNTYDSQNNFLEAFNLPATHASNAGNFFGLNNVGIASATLTTGFGGDWVFVDNFTYASGAGAPVPEPSTIFLLGVGLAGVSVFGRKFRKS